MKIEGTVYKSGKFWLSEIPILDLMSQGKTKKEAIEMISDAITQLVHSKGFKVQFEFNSKKKEFLITSNSTDKVISLILKRQREKSGLTISDVTSKLGFSSRNAYARYESSKAPSISFNKFIDLYSCITGADVTIK